MSIVVAREGVTSKSGRGFWGASVIKEQNYQHIAIGATGKNLMIRGSDC
jgi:hypothetical protein